MCDFLVAFLHTSFVHLLSHVNYGSFGMALSFKLCESGFIWHDFVRLCE